MLGLTGYSLFLSDKIVTSEKQTTKTEQTSSQTTQAEAKTTSSGKNAVQKALPNARTTDWNLVLVGPYNKITNEIDESQLATISDGSHQVDSRIVDAFNSFSTAATAAGYPLVTVSSFRSVSAQTTVFNNSVAKFEAQGETEEQAIADTKLTITEPGYSEHHTGLAVDIVDQDWYNNYPSTLLEASYGEQAGAKWIAENAPKYGFIIRYPDGEESITGITYEPWHIRYVGKANAEYITKHNLTLEEFLEQLGE